MSTEEKNCKLDNETEFFEIRPAADIADDEDGAEITFEVPGANAKSVEVEVDDRILSVTAKSTLTRAGLPVVYKRAFHLSDAVDIGKISAKTLDGVLTLALPKSEKAKVHRIEVK